METLGYGANQKTCYQTALERGAEVVVMLHPDYQYDARLLGVMVDIIETGVCDIVLGNRIRRRSDALNNGMPIWKYFVNRLSTFFENFILGQTLGEFHSGFRAYSRKALTSIPFMENSDDFVFDQEVLIQATFLGLRLGDIPVPVRYMSEASSINFRRSIRYGISTIACLVSYFLAKSGIRNDPRFVSCIEH
jgi:glycosyltransferase involved in cell wall biosynthesis